MWPRLKRISLLAIVVSSGASAQLSVVPPVTNTVKQITKALQSKPSAIVQPIVPVTTRLGRAATTLTGRTTDAVNGVVAGSPLLGPTLNHITGTIGNLPSGGTTQQLSLSTGAPRTAPVQTETRSSFAGLGGGGGLTGNELAEGRVERMSTLVATSGGTLEADALGNPIIGGRILLVDPTEVSIQHLVGRDFRVIADDRQLALGLRVVTLRVPAGVSTARGLVLARSEGAGATADFDHLYQPAGGGLGASAATVAVGRARSGSVIGMIDGGVASHPAIAASVRDQRGFAGPVRASDHGTAVASLLVGRQGRFSGAAAGKGALLVADVYGGRSNGGSATAIAKALDWLVASSAKVVNISLVGPTNALLERSIMAARARGVSIVAAVGNDGPASPPQFPASYPGVLSSTGVDAKGNALFEAGNAAHVDFAAPGADMAAAAAAGGYRKVRGTSFASALVAGRLQAVGSLQRLTSEAKPGKGRVGRGIVCGPCRVDPSAVGAR